MAVTPLKSLRSVGNELPGGYCVCVYVCGVLCAMCVGGLVVDGNQTNKKTWPLYGFREQIPGWFLHCFTVVILLFRLRSGKKKTTKGSGLFVRSLLYISVLKDTLYNTLSG